MDSCVHPIAGPKATWYVLIDLSLTKLSSTSKIGWTQEGLEAMERPNLSAVQTVYNILEQAPGNELMKRAEEKDVKECKFLSASWRSCTI